MKHTDNKHFIIMIGIMILSGDLSTMNKMMYDLV